MHSIRRQDTFPKRKWIFTEGGSECPSRKSWRSITRRGEQSTHQARFPWPLLHFAESHENKLKNTILQHILTTCGTPDTKTIEIAGMLMVIFVSLVESITSHHSFTYTHSYKETVIL